MSKFFQNNLGGGINTKTSSFLAKPNELELGRNISLNQIGSIKKRFGFGDANVLQASKKVLGAYEFVITNTGAKYLIAITNNSGGTNAVLKYRTTPNGTFTVHLDADCSALQANTEFEFSNFITGVYSVAFTQSITGNS